MKTLVAFVIAVVAGLVLSLMFRLGAFKSVALSESDAGPFKIVSKLHVGPYHKIVPVIEEVEKWARANNEPCKLSFGEFLDNIETVPEDRLKSNAGCIVEKEWKSGLPEGFEYREIPSRRYVLAEFEGAPSIGPQKVYPKAKEYISKHGLIAYGATIEMYEILPDSKIKTRYYFPVKAN